MFDNKAKTSWTDSETLHFSTDLFLGGNHFPKHPDRLHPCLQFLGAFEQNNLLCKLPASFTFTSMEVGPNYNTNFSTTLSFSHTNSYTFSYNYVSVF